MASGGKVSIEQVVTGLQPWTKYLLTAWISVGTAGDTALLGVKNYGNAELKTPATSTGYQQYSLTFITGAANTQATVYFYMIKTGVVYADDFQLTVTPVARANYYIDNITGDDSNNGLTPSTAWKTLSKVNATTFFAGDSILFKYDGQWTGTLHPLGEGKPGQPIVISRYGGTTSKPVFNGNGALRTVYLTNQQYWHITNLEVTNTASAGQKKRGIEVENINRGRLTGIRILNNNVHDVLGDNTKGQDGSTGIMAVVRKSSYGNIPSWFDSLLIEGNVVKNVKRTGISTSSDWRCKTAWGCTSSTDDYTPLTHLVIRNNYVENAGGDGIVPMVCDAALIEYNMVNGANVSSGTANAGIWCFIGSRNVFQFNEAYNVKTAIDGQGYDVDFMQDSTLFQYNYSHDNEGGFMLLCTNRPNSNNNAVVRYNVSQNDKYRIILFNGNVTNAHVYNNTMYLPAGSTTKPIAVENWGNSYPSNIYVRNNIFYLTAAGPWTNWDSIGGAKIFEHNIVYGAHTAGEPSGINNLSNNPLLAAPGTGTTGSFSTGVITFGNVDGYQLQSGSPAIGAGMVIPDNGGRDYWGNPVPSGNAPDIGAYNSSLAPAKKNTGTIKTKTTLAVYPNPAGKRTQLNITVTTPAAGTGLLDILDMNGRSVYARKVALHAGNNYIQARLQDHPSGVYFARVVTGNEKTVYRFIME